MRYKHFLPVPLALLCLFVLPGYFLQNTANAQIVSFAASTFEGNTVSTTFTAGEAVLSRFQGPSIQLSSGILSPGDWHPVAGSTDDPVPARFHLHNNYPNPFNPVTKISYELPETADVRIEIYNTVGARVAILESSNRQAGSHTISFDAARLSSGVYIYRMTANGMHIATRKMTLIK
jgi:hypothetical protein